jgi:hypothetical protein
MPTHGWLLSRQCALWLLGNFLAIPAEFSCQPYPEVRGDSCHWVNIELITYVITINSV